MNYQKLYNAIVERAKTRQKPDCYTERHHIIPRSLGGNDSPENLVILTAREHCLAHLLLAKIHNGSMWHAAAMMTNRFKLKSKAYAISKEKSANILKGRKLSKETCEKMSKSKQGENHPFFGKTGRNHNRFKGFVIAKCLETGKETIYEGKQAVINAGFIFTHVSACIRKKRKSHKGHTFKRVPLC